MKKGMALLLAVLLCLPLLSSVVIATDDADEDYKITELKMNDTAMEPIPLLVILINFDADNDGVDDSGSANGAKAVGEQWCHSTEAEWAARCFGDSGKTLFTYYREMTGGKFWFTAAAENSGTVNNGIVTVTIPYAHPHFTTGEPTAEDGSSRIAALNAASEYVDFASFDKDGSGRLGLDEMAILFVCGGYEYSSSKETETNVFGVWAHYTTGSGVKLDGVTAQSAGFVRLGEYSRGTNIATVGTMAHELAHFLGAPDLYDIDKKNVGITWSYAGDLTLMASGSHIFYDGETSGASPAYLDPYDMESLGFADISTVLDGTYTMYSRQSKVGNYNIIKINTPNPSEYYLVENRYGTTTSDFDAISSGAKGIQIWHVDEQAVGSGRVNSEGEGHDPGIIPLGVFKLATPYAFYNNGNSVPDYYSFDSDKYVFPVSGTAYTALTEEEAAGFNLRIDILSPVGTEMQIKVTGAAELTPTLALTSADKTTTSLVFNGNIRNLNAGYITDCGMILSTKTDYKEDANAVTVHIKPDEYGKVSYLFEGLKSNTKYFCTIFTDGSAGYAEKQTTGYTAAEYVPRDYYYAHLFMGKTSVERSFDVKLRPDDLIPDKVTASMTKFGYVFGGWYKDENFTERFDLNSTQTELMDYSLFAKWIPEYGAAMLTLANATSRYGVVAASEIGDTFAVPDIAAREGYTFGGWFTDEACTAPYDFGKVIEDTDGLTLYVNWIPDNPPETTVTDTTPTETTVAETTDSETTVAETTTSDTVLTETTASETTSTVDTAIVEPAKEKPVAAIVISVIAVLAVACVVVVVLKKKKK